MPISHQPIDDPDAMAERILELERQRAQTKRSSLSGPIDPSPALLNPYSLELVGTGLGNTNTPPPFLPHALGGEGSPHTGTLLNVQGPQFAMIDGSRPYGGHLTPSSPDTWDLGQSLKPWRSLYTSEIRSTIFRRYEQFLISGIYSVAHGSGSFKTDVTDAATQIDFGQTMTENDIVVVRADNSGAPMVEYIKVGVLVSGTTYYVTRNLDGSGANAWNKGTVYMVQGTTGDGWINLDATEGPKLSVLHMTGSSYSSYLETLRIGNLNGAWGYSPTYAIYGMSKYGSAQYGQAFYGAAFGAYAPGKANITIDPINGVRIRNYDQDVIKLNGTDLNLTNNLSDSVGAVIIDSLGFHYYNSGDERVRIGALDNWDGGSFIGLKGIAIGDYQSEWLMYDQTNGLQIKGNIKAESGYLKNLSIDGTLTLSSAGKLLQGTGAWGTDFTGTAIWSESSVMNIGGWNAGVKQWWGGSDGRFYAGEGSIRLDTSGINIILSQDENVGYLRFQSTDLMYDKIFMRSNLYDALSIANLVPGGEINQFIKGINGVSWTARFWFPATNIPQFSVDGQLHVLPGWTAAIGVGATPVYGLIVRSTGNTTATAALLLENSDGTDLFSVNSVGSTWIVGNCSALSFTDRTPFYKGDALAEINKIKGKLSEIGKEEIDHDSLPDFARVQKKDDQGNTIKERDLGAMISMLTVAVQQLDKKINELKKIGA